MIQIKANEKYDASRTDERHRDHALFTAFAPLDQPRIALAMVVENAGFGAGAAAPIARRVFDYVLKEQYPSEADIGRRSSASRPSRSASRERWIRAAAGATVNGAATARADPRAGRAQRAGVGARARCGAAARDRARGRPRPARAAATTDMSAVFEGPSLWRRVRPIFTG